LKRVAWYIVMLSAFGLTFSACGDDSNPPGDSGLPDAPDVMDATTDAPDVMDAATDAPDPARVRSSSASYADLVKFGGSQSTASGEVYEILPGPAALNPAADPTPFSNNTGAASGSYRLAVSDTSAEDSESSTDAVTDVEIRFTGSDGTNYLIDGINVIHKPLGAGDHSFFGGVGSNVVMHGDTGLGTAMMPKMLAYITLWGMVNLKDADTGAVLATGRIIHIMTGTRVRDASKQLVLGVDSDLSDHDINMAETHVILPPLDATGAMSPVPGTAHGFLHMMFENVELTAPSRDPSLAYEILPGPAAIDPAMTPTPFSNRIAVGAGSYSLTVRDVDAEDSTDSMDAVDNFSLSFTLDDGTTYTADAINIIHKPLGAGDHSFMGGVGIDTIMHGDTGLGTALMPKMLAYITLWGMVDLKDESGTVVASNRIIHLMVASRARTSDLELITDTATDATDHSPTMVETHIILPPVNMAGEMDPIPGTRHGFLHLMFEQVTLSD